MRHSLRTSGSQQYTTCAGSRAAHSRPASLSCFKACLRRPCQHHMVHKQVQGTPAPEQVSEHQSLLGGCSKGRVPWPVRLDPEEVKVEACAALQGHVCQDLTNNAAELEAVPRACRAQQPPAHAALVSTSTHAGGLHGAWGSTCLCWGWWSMMKCWSVLHTGALSGGAAAGTGSGACGRAPVGEHAAGRQRHGAVRAREEALHAVPQYLLVRGVDLAVQLVGVCAATQVAAAQPVSGRRVPQPAQAVHALACPAHAGESCRHSRPLTGHTAAACSVHCRRPGWAAHLKRPSFMPGWS